MKCEKGLCLVCECVIAKPCGECGISWKQMGNATSVEIQWSNGSKMSIPVCMDCAIEKVWKEDRMALTKAIWDAWDRLGASYSKDIVLV